MATEGIRGETQGGAKCPRARSTQRKSEAFRLLSELALTAEQLVDYEVFDDTEQAGQFLRRQAKRGETQCVGFVMTTPTGRPKKVYTRGWRPQANHVQHDNLLANIALLLGPEHIRCRNVDRDVRPDAEAHFPTEDGVETWYLELTRYPSMSYAEIVSKRFTKYVNTKHPVLWIVHASTPEEAEMWMEGLRRRAGKMNDPFFTTYHRLMEDPFGPVLSDLVGHPATLPET